MTLIIITIPTTLESIIPRPEYPIDVESFSKSREPSEKNAFVRMIKTACEMNQCRRLVRAITGSPNLSGSDKK
jgi:hypothetical protein